MARSHGDTRWCKMGGLFPDFRALAQLPSDPPQEHRLPVQDLLSHSAPAAPNDAETVERPWIFSPPSYHVQVAVERAMLDTTLLENGRCQLLQGKAPTLTRRSAPHNVEVCALTRIVSFLFRGTCFVVLKLPPPAAVNWGMAPAHGSTARC